MKTIITRTVEMGFQSASFLIVMAFCLFATNADAQQKNLTHSEQSTTTSGTWQANIFPSSDPLLLKIVLVNPERESLLLTVRNEAEEPVYTRVINRAQMYNSKLDVSGLPDGRYTFELSGKTNRFAQSFEIFTQTARLTHMQ